MEHSIEGFRLTDSGHAPQIPFAHPSILWPRVRQTDYENISPSCDLIRAHLTTFLTSTEDEAFGSQDP